MGTHFFNKKRKTSIFCKYKSSTSFLLTWLSPGRSRKIEYLILLRRTQWRQMRRERPATHFPSWILKMKYDECQDPIFTPSARGRPLLRLHLHQAHPWGPWMFICHCTSGVEDKSCNTSWFSMQPNSILILEVFTQVLLVKEREQVSNCQTNAKMYRLQLTWLNQLFTGCYEYETDTNESTVGVRQRVDG